MMRIVQFLNTVESSDGGPARNAVELHLAFRAMNHTAELFVINQPRKDVRTVLPDEDANVVAHGGAAEGFILSRLNRILTLIRALPGVLSRNDVVVVHGFFLWWIPLVVLVAKGAGRQVWCTPHGSLTDYDLRHSRWRKELFIRAISPVVAKGLRGFAVGSEREAEELRKNLSKVAIPVVVVGVGTEQLSLAPSESPLHNPKRLLTMSRLATKKRIDIAVDCAAVLLARGVEFRLEILGDGPMLPSLKRQVSSLRLEDVVEFSGEVVGTEKHRKLMTADILLMPSDDENFGIGAAEALAAGIPVAASVWVDALANIHGTAVVKIQNCNPVSLADAVEKLLEQAYPQVRREARTVAEDAYSWRDVAERWTRGFATAEGSPS